MNRIEEKIKYAKNGFTAVELIVTMLIIPIIGGTSAASLIYVVQILIYMPADMNTKRIAEEIADTILEGDIPTRGLRYANAIMDASATQLTYSYGYPETVKYVRYSSSSNRVMVSTSQDNVAWTTAQAVPSNITSDIVVRDTAGGASIFSYYKADSSSPFTPNAGTLKDIRRVDLAIAVSSNSARLGGSDASFTVTSGVDIKQYN